MTDYMLDSNMFDEFLDGHIDIDLLQDSDATIYVTPVQETELEKTPGSRGEELIETMETISDENVPSLFMWDVEGAGWGQGAWGGEEAGMVSQAIRDAHAPDEHQDVNLGTVAVTNDLTLVTSDTRLQNAMDRTYPDSYTTREDFVSELSE